ncbi:hypothetical protein NKG94_16285 [Micromonospora sp. M12]
MMYQAQLTVFLGSLSALMHATAMLGATGMKATEAMPELIASAESIGAILRAGEKRPAPRWTPENTPAISVRSP